MSTRVNCVTRSARSSVPVASQSSDIQDTLDALAIARNVRGPFACVQQVSFRWSLFEFVEGLHEARLSTSLGPGALASMWANENIEWLAPRENLHIRGCSFPGFCPTPGERDG